MANKPSNAKWIIFALVAFIGGVTGYGYFNQTAQLTDEPKAESTLDAKQAAQQILAPKPSDIILGDNNALVTMVEYSSLTCPHCAHFSTNILPALEKEFITTGKLKLVLRHFPLNDPAFKASQIAECAGRNNLARESFIKVFYEMQTQWAFGENFLKDLKQIAAVGGMDSAAFDSCLEDKTIETRVLTQRQDAAEKLGVTSTPSFFINGVKYTGEPTVEALREAITAAGE